MFEYDDKLLRKGQAAAYLEISVRSLDRLMASKSLPYVKILNNVYFLESDLESFLESSKVLPEDPKRLERIDRARIQTLEKRLDFFMKQRFLIEEMKKQELVWFDLSETQRNRYEKASEIILERSSDVFTEMRSLDARIKQRKKRLEERGITKLGQQVSGQGAEERK